MWQPTFRKYDIESGTSQPLYPMMLESPELRWSFIRKIYSIVAVSAVVVYVRPVAAFFLTTSAGSALYILLIITPFIGKVILEAVILTSVVVVGLTLYTFWAASRGYDFNSLGPILVLMVFGFIQMSFPLEKTSLMIYGCLASIIFCAYIVYDTDNLINRPGLQLLSI